MPADLTPMLAVPAELPAEDGGWGYEYKSKQTLFGWPLVHVAFGRDAKGKLRVAKGVIAVGQFGFERYRRTAEHAVASQRIGPGLAAICAGCSAEAKSGSVVVIDFCGNGFEALNLSSRIAEVVRLGARG